MKEKLIKLINDIPKIEREFRISNTGDGLLPTAEYIYDVPDFIEWKQALLFELQEIYSRTSDRFIYTIINSNGLLSKINGRNFNDRKSFNELKGALLAIKDHISNYYPNDALARQPERNDNTMKKPKIFISHSSTDKEIVLQFVELLADMGITNEFLFCSSIPDYGIPLNNDIYDYLRSLLVDHEVYVIFMLSQNYYNSTPCLNEMGAAWVLKSDYTSILLPNFSYSEIKGAVNPNKIGLSFDDENDLLKSRLGELMNLLSEKINLHISQARWERKRDQFIEHIKNSSNERTKSKLVLSEVAINILQNAKNSNHAQIIKTTSFSGTSICAGNSQINNPEDVRDTAKAEAALKELKDLNYIAQKDEKGLLFQITDSGFNFINTYK